MPFSQPATMNFAFAGLKCGDFKPVIAGLTFPVIAGLTRNPLLGERDAGSGAGMTRFSVIAGLPFLVIAGLTRNPLLGERDAGSGAGMTRFSVIAGLTFPVIAGLTHNLTDGYGPLSESYCN